jgi:hypothetical protein
MTMYTLVERRTINAAAMEETVRRANEEFFPQLQASAGFVGFYLVNDDTEGVQTAILVWNTKAEGEGFLATQRDWWAALDSLGQRLLTANAGETVIELTPKD